MGLLNKFTKKKKDEDKVAEKSGDMVLSKKDADKKNKINGEDNVVKSVSVRPEVKGKQKKEKRVENDNKPAQGKNGIQAGGAAARRVLLRPLVSEKAALAEANGVYTFVVDRSSNKLEIKRSIREIYGVMPKKVRIMNFEGKRIYFGRRTGKRKDWKKAIVILPKGKTISIHEGV